MTLYEFVVKMKLCIDLLDYQSIPVNEQAGALILSFSISFSRHLGNL